MTTRDEAEAERGRRWRLRVALVLRHGERGAVRDGSTMGETPAELRAAAHALLETLLDRLAATLPSEDDDEP